jgi:nicotinate-nucleotide adenylyltransferase
MNNRSFPPLAADAVVLAGEGPDMRLLVVERGCPPFKGQMALPGGFLERGEAPFQGGRRELMEETGLDLTNHLGIHLRPRARPGRDPRGWVLSQPLLFHLPKPIKPRAGDDAAAAEWVALAELERLAFDHGAMLCEALGRFWPNMPTAAPEFRGLVGYRIPQHLDWSEVTFFGGSFNPWHQGHEACINRFSDPARLVVVPDTNPFKGQVDRGCAWQFLRELEAQLAGSECALFPGFCGMEEPNPTVAWLPFVEAERRALLMGEDTFFSFPDWNQAARLAAALDAIHVVPRRTEGDGWAHATVWFHRHQPNCRIVRLADHPYRDYSSSYLRDRNQHPENTEESP